MVVNIQDLFSHQERDNIACNNITYDCCVYIQYL